MHEELYDIKVDIGEAHDLARDPSHATTVRQLRVGATHFRGSGRHSAGPHAAVSVTCLQFSDAIASVPNP